MRTQPGAEQRPDALHGVDVHLAEAVAVLVAGILAAAVADRLVPVAPGRQARVDVVFVSVDQAAPSICAAEVEAIRTAWAGCPDGYAKAATPVTSAQV